MGMKYNIISRHNNGWNVFTLQVPPLSFFRYLIQNIWGQEKEIDIIGKIPSYVASNVRKYNVAFVISEIRTWRGNCSWNKPYANPGSLMFYGPSSSIRSDSCGFDSTLAIPHSSPEIYYLPNQNNNLSDSSEYGYNTYTDCPPLICVVALYLLGTIAGAVLGCWGALYVNNDRKFIGATLICAGLGLCALSSVSFALGRGWP
jgi:hypothetical protein